VEEETKTKATERRMLHTMLCGKILKDKYAMRRSVNTMDEEDR